MTINKLLIAMALGLALTACSKPEQAQDSAASANEAAADAQKAADQAAASPGFHEKRKTLVPLRVGIQSNTPEICGSFQKWCMVTLNEIQVKDGSFWGRAPFNSFPYNGTRHQPSLDSNRSFTDHFGKIVFGA